MEFRKIIAFGKSSFVVSLPKEWLEKNNLKKGDTLFITEEKDRLQILPEEKEEPVEEVVKIIHTKGKDLKRIRREIYSSYLQHNHTLILEGKEVGEYSKKLIQTIHNLVALEVVEQTSERIVARDFLRPQDINIADNLKKADLIIRSIFLDLLNKDFSNYGELLDREESVDRIFFLVLKVLRSVFNDLSLLKKLNLDGNKLHDLFTLNESLRNISKLVKRVVRNWGSISDVSSFRVEIDKIFSFYLAVMKVLFTKNVENAFSLSNRRDEIVSSLLSFRCSCEADYVAREQLMNVARELHDVLRRIYVRQESL